MLFTYIFLVGFFISTAVCEEESGPQEPNEEAEQPVESVASTATTTTTTAAPRGRARRDAQPPPTKTNVPSGPEQTKAKGSSGFGVKAKKFAGKLAKGTKKAAKATVGAAKTTKNKIVKKKK